MSLKRLFREQGMYVVLIAAVVLTAILLQLSGHLGKNPFASALYLDSPVQASAAEDAAYYLDSASYRIIVTDSEGVFRREIPGGDPENTFDYCAGLQACPGGTFLMVEKSFLEDGASAAAERILRFDSYGRKRQVLYELETAPDGVTQTADLFCPILVGDQVRFAQLDDAGVHLFSITEGAEAEEYAFMPLEDGFRRVYNLSFDEQGRIFLVMMNGEVLCWDGAATARIWDAEERGTEDYCSLIRDAVPYGEELLLNDVGRRVVWSLPLAGGEPRIVTGPDTFFETGDTDLAGMPLYTDMNRCGDRLSFLVSTYAYNMELDEHEYGYQLGTVDLSDGTASLTDSCAPSIRWRLEVILCYLVVLALAAILVLVVFRLVRLLRAHSRGGSHTQVIVLIVSLVVTFVVARAVFNTAMTRFVQASNGTLAGIGYLLDETLDRQDLAQFDSPKAFDTDAYDRVDAAVQRILNQEETTPASAYVVIYRVKDDVIYEAYQSTNPLPIMYPLAGTFRNSAEAAIAESGEIYIMEDMELSEGNYSYVDIPIYDTDGSFCALVEIGEDYTTVQAQNNSFIRAVMIQAFMIVIIVMLLLSEVLSGAHAVSLRKQRLRASAPMPPELIRPIAFMVFFTANITTAFLPIYGMNLWNERFPLPQELAAALPLSAELVVGAVFSVICGRLLRRISPKTACAIGAVFYILGNLFSILSRNLWMLIAANSCCGIGGGLLLVSINTWITMRNGESEQNRGFIQYNAAYLAGLNCGCVIGALLWEQFGMTSAYLAAGISAAVLLLLVLLLMDSGKQQLLEETVHRGLRSLLTPRVIRYFLLMAVPYLICASFLNYFFPIIAEQNQLSASEISMAFLISGVISIYVGTEIGEPVVARLGVRQSMIFASFIYAVALGYLVWRPSIISCYVVIVLFALADSFGLAAQSVYYSALPEVQRYGESGAMAFNSTVESVTSAAGSLIFGAALLLGVRLGIALIGGVFALLLGLFVWRDSRGKVHSEPAVE